MKKLTVAMLAHVDAGKTTLAEAMLYLGGCIRRLGRVDRRDTFFDTHALERARGITVFSKQAVLETPDMTLFLLDTPGHTDFAAETERVLSVIDYAILVISAADGVQLHTETLWRLLAGRGIPVFLFINKTDLPCPARETLMETLHAKLSPACADFSLLDTDRGLFDEQTAVSSDALTEEYLETGALSDRSLAKAIAERAVFPCVFGAALKLDGVPAFLHILNRYTVSPVYPDAFSAVVWKIGHDARDRLVFLKITGGTLKVKTPLSGVSVFMGKETAWEEKIDAIRIYSGEKYRAVDTVSAGDICCVTGLSHCTVGEGLGAAADAPKPLLLPVLSYRLVLPPDAVPQEVFPRLCRLCEEDPTLSLSWNAQLGQIFLSLMGEIQMDVLSAVIKERLGIDVTFDTGSIAYRETVSAPVIGYGHFEPLRHYADVRFYIEPGEPGSGVVFDSVVPENDLHRSWQRLILGQIEETLPHGVLTDSPLADLRITLIGGRAHIKHTEGGDFREAATRAVRQGLMKARQNGTAVLLEPWFDFRLTLPVACLGHALLDLERMAAVIRTQTVSEDGETAEVRGCAPAAELRTYPAALRNFSRGRGQLTFSPHGYAPCHNTDAVVAEIGYNPSQDVGQPADSVFCHNGAGVIVPWDALDAQITEEDKKEEKPHEMKTARLDAKTGACRTRALSYSDRMEEDRELKAIFERTYGKIAPRSIFVPPPPVTEVKPSRETYLARLDPSADFLLVDGYNIIFSWDELKRMARDSLDLARNTLIHLLSNYQGYKNNNVILVFDAYRVDGGTGGVERHAGLYVVYTRAKETADTYIEKVTYDIGREHRVRVATSDALEQVIVMGHGAIRLSAQNLHDEVSAVSAEIEAEIERLNQKEK